MDLANLFKDLAETQRAHGLVPVAGLTADSRAVTPGMVFAALSGAKTDGAKFAAHAVAQGAVAILASTGAPLPEVAVPVYRSAEPRRALAVAASRLHPRQPATIVAITGTSGKSSVADFVRQIYAHAGKQAASLGTVGVVKPGGATYGSLTTPDPLSLHRILDELAGEGITHLAFEASSHGLDQYRVDGVKLAAGAFLNLGRDHLDYHPTVEAYLEAKLRLFSHLLETGQPAVINADGAYAQAVITAASLRGLKIYTTGRNGIDLRVRGVERDGFGQRLTIATGGRIHHVTLPLVGTYQVENALVAAGLAIVTGVPDTQAIPALAHLRGVKGRLDIIGRLNGGLALVDYAHKPDALAAVLTALRPFATGRLISVFGCGGDRDRGKRPIMGKISVETADVTIVTDDNPRTEQAAAIRAEVLGGAKGAREIGDRAEAIRAAVRMMGPGDVVVIAGKGHEEGQIVGSTVLPFSDHDEVRRALLAAGGEAAR